MNQDTDLFKQTDNNESTLISYSRVLVELLFPFVFIALTLTLPFINGGIPILIDIPILTLIFLIGYFSVSEPKVGRLSELALNLNSIPSNIIELKSWLIENPIVLLFVYFIAIVTITIHLVWDVVYLFGVTSLPFSPILLLFFQSLTVAAGLGIFHGLEKNNTIISGIKYGILFLASILIVAILYALLMLL